MTTQDDQNNADENAQNAARESIHRGEDIANDVRNIVVDALKNGKMEPDDIKKVLRAVTDGAFEAADSSEQDTADIMKKTVSGMDDALTRIAQASKLAIEEASGNLEKFSDYDLKKAMDDLEDLESLFLQTLKDFAESGQETTRGIMNDLVKHAQQSGTSVGNTISETSNELYKLLSVKGKDLHPVDAARAAGASIASIASGMLAGIAESLQGKEEK